MVSRGTSCTGNRIRGRRFILNCDCNDVDLQAPAGRAQGWIRDWYRMAVDAGADVLVADVALPDVVETKDTPSGEIIGARFSEDPQDKVASADHGLVCDDYPERSRSTRAYGTIAELMTQGTDVLHLACEEGHKAGAIVLGGMRMSDAHQGRTWRPRSNDPLMSQFVMDHPEWCNTWEDGSLDATLSYAIPQVRAHRLQILREMAENYEIDGVELNWMRWCRHFPHGRQREYLDVLTQFVGQVRRMLDDVAHRKGIERMVLGHRLPVTLDECLNIGCDVAGWAQKGYADFFAPMDFLFVDLNTHTEEFVEAAKGASCLVYPGFGSIKYSIGREYDDNNLYEGKDNHRAVMMRSLDMFRAVACNSYAWGADGTSSFNMYCWQQEQQDFFRKAVSVLSSVEAAVSGPRHYLYLPVWKYSVSPTSRTNAQCIIFGGDTMLKRQAFDFRMADGRGGGKLKGTLRFRIYDAQPDDRFMIDLNGVKVPVDKISMEYQPNGEVFEEPEGAESLPQGEMPEVFRNSVPFSWPANLRFEIALADCPAFRGDNELGITLVEKPSSGTVPVMEALEVLVRGE